MKTFRVFAAGLAFKASGSAAMSPGRISIPSKFLASRYDTFLQSEDALYPRASSKTLVQSIKDEVCIDIVKFHSLKRLKYNQNGWYSTEICVGTPHQCMVVQVDPGSSDLWLNTPGVCENHGCDLYGLFNKKASKSAHPVFNEVSVSSGRPIPQQFENFYEDGFDVKGVFVTDTISFGGQAGADVQFGLAYEGKRPFGILGLGYEETQAAVIYGFGKSYPNILSIFTKNKSINLKAFSIGFNDAASGLLVFGGIDTAKIEGKLATFSVDPSKRYFVYANQIRFSTSSSNPKSFSGKVRLDFGHTLTFLPTDFVNTIWKATNAVIAHGLPYVDCHLPSMFLDLTFSSAKIRIPLSDLLFDNTSPPSGVPPCLLPFLPVASSGRIKDVLILGNALLRKLYIVYDQTNSKISIAKAKITHDSNIVSLSAGGVEAYYTSIAGVGTLDGEPATSVGEPVVGAGPSGNPASSFVTTDATLPAGGTPTAGTVLTDNIFYASQTQQRSSSTSASSTEAIKTGGFITPNVVSFNPPSPNDRLASLSDGTETGGFSDGSLPDSLNR